MRPPVSNSSHFDVVIVGGGIIGSAAAYFLTANPDFHGSVLVVERDSSYSRCSTTRSAGSIRQQFSSALNVEISKFGYRFLKQSQELLKIEGEDDIEIGFIDSSYLTLTGDDGVEELKTQHQTQVDCGAQVAFYEKNELTARFPWLNSDGLGAGCQGLAGEGWFNPNALLMGLRRKAISLGSEYREDEVVDIQTNKTSIGQVTLKSGERINYGALLNATGPNASQLATMIGVALPVSPRKRNVFIFKSPANIEAMPLVVDPSGFYVRPEGNCFISGWSPAIGDPDPDDASLEVDHDVFDEIIWPNLAHRIPQFEQLRVISSYAGHYDFNSFDHNGIVGKHPTIGNLYFANGFSGHGLQQAPAVGRAISELIIYGEYKTLDLGCMAYARILSGREFGERIII